MTDDEKKVVEEKTREKYFYIDKEKTYQILTNIATSFIGAGLAIAIFAATHKPPVPPCHLQFNHPMPCPMKMYEFNRQPNMFPPHREFKGHKRFSEFNTKKFHLRKDFDRQQKKDLNGKFPVPNVNEQKTAPKN